MRLALVAMLVVMASNTNSSDEAQPEDGNTSSPEVLSPDGKPLRYSGTKRDRKLAKVWLLAAIGCLLCGMPGVLYTIRQVSYDIAYGHWLRPLVLATLLVIVTPLPILVYDARAHGNLKRAHSLMWACLGAAALAICYFLYSSKTAMV